MKADELDNQLSCNGIWFHIIYVKLFNMIVIISSVIVIIFSYNCFSIWCIYHLLSRLWEV